MLPPPAITTRFAGASSLRISLMNLRMSSRAAMKNTSSFSSMTVSPSGLMLRPRAVDSDHARFGVRMMFLSAASFWLTSRPPLRARMPTSRTRPSAKSSTCNAPGNLISCSMYSVTSCSGLIHTSTDSASSANNFGCLRVFGGADARDLRARAIQRVRHLAGHHVDFVARRQRHHDVGRRAARGFEHGWIGGVAGDRADVEPILQIAQHFFIGVDDRDLVGFFARQVVCRGAPDLAGAEYHDLHGGGIVAVAAELAKVNLEKYAVRIQVTSEPRAHARIPRALQLRPAGALRSAANNTFGLTGEGKLIVDAHHAHFRGQTQRFSTLGGLPRIALADIANVDYNADNARVCYARATGEHYIVVWLRRARMPRRSGRCCRRRRRRSSSRTRPRTSASARPCRRSARARCDARHHRHQRRGVHRHAGAGADLVHPIPRYTSASVPTSVR